MKPRKLEKNMKKKKRNAKTPTELKDKYYEKLGITKRDKLEEGYLTFKFDAMLQETRLKSGLTQ
jgi:hypothetical protein